MSSEEKSFLKVGFGNQPISKPLVTQAVKGCQNTLVHQTVIRKMVMAVS